MASYGSSPTDYSAKLAPTQVQNRNLCSAAHVLLGPSLAMSNLWARLQRVAPYFRTALLTGESGSGQQAVARALHELSPLRERGFAVITAADAESKLAQDTGLKASAALGMLYLPEPDRLSQAAQVGLMRLLRERGSNAPRLVTFAERGLRSLISACAFSSELANSLGALQIEVPPLRQRTEDIPLLVGHLLRRQAESLSLRPPALADDFFDAAASLPWPGNLDQMQAALRWMLEHSGSVLHGADLHAALTALAQTTSTAPAEPRLVRLDQIVREQVHAVLMACNGNKLRAAEILGISRSTLYRMLGASGPGWPLPEGLNNANQEMGSQSESHGI
jgi:DNA-binding NtrC family response regulator